ncbi:hypothetical protein PCANB_000549 [Pneumocystis canis]|nr:hypothetical protein PCK1_000453 [Pneumocystis canis]KAG5437834.1 hypothetical protein PCANB_000549 [Pneumocystis canis]
MQFRLKYTARTLRNNFNWTFSRSSGPGGQNANKRNTKVQLRVHPNSLPSSLCSDSSSPSFGRRTRNGTLIFSSQQHRTQAANRRACLSKLDMAIKAANHATTMPKPSIEKQQRIHARVISASQERLKKKRWHSNKKASRRLDHDVSIIF